jgi:hypothetical protein
MGALLMLANFRTALLASLALGVFASAMATPARAEDAASTAAEIRELKARLMSLEKRLDAQAHAQAQTQQEVQRVAAHGPLPTTKGSPIEVCPPASSATKV